LVSLGPVLLLKMLKFKVGYLIDLLINTLMIQIAGAFFISLTSWRALNW
jgi:hypothetical protein